MLRKSMRKLLALIVAVVIGLVLLRWLSEQSRIEAEGPGSWDRNALGYGSDPPLC